MRRCVRMVLVCVVCGFGSMLYALNQLSPSVEAKARKPERRAARQGGRAAGREAAGPGLAPRRWHQRYEDDKTHFPGSLKKPVEKMQLAVVACGERLEETVTMLKSALLCSIKPLQFHIFAEDELHAKFRSVLETWPLQEKFNYTLYPITFPSENAADWKKLFKPCASQRLFLPLILKDVDSLLYVDTDILFLRPIDDLWSFLKEFNSTQIAAMAPEHEEPRIGWYNRFARHPYYGKTGINSGVVLMNMTRIMRKYFKNDLTTARLQWGDLLMPLLKKYKLNITWGDQDLLNIIFYHNPESLFVFPCHWNYRPDHCIYGSNCKEAEAEGVFVLHGNRGVYHNEKQPVFRAVYEAIRNYSFGDDPFRSLLHPLEMELQKTTHTYCGRIHQVFTKQLKKSLSTLRYKLSEGT
ncbi:glucoside xylosyltransferase 1 [Latimeria chalumnae]|uniref:glucoside xylosyltransferase 1 n=1 Tax=Latimeria chalumnae TaxID=7897 RepID=UPI0003C16285|nr:PREDICTED: glucoside xylosyltransferase 1 isoform X1 [Latimeria chalumnae]|eukprot:XP_005993231.1 PREDICTED: glucoside xylosyltransferase 1 isoform X1 [Latimeria chalumnae]